MFKPPSRKETHYFDNTKILSDPKSKKSHGRPASQYALSYPRWSDSIDTSKLMTGEATPSYILRLDAPKMMAATLPHARLLLIIRNPVDRAYSEYQMKYRRVVRLFDPHDSRDIVPLLGDIAPCYSLEWEDVENPEMQRRDLENPGMQRRRRHVVSDPPPCSQTPCGGTVSALPEIQVGITVPADSNAEAEEGWAAWSCQLHDPTESAHCSDSAGELSRRRATGDARSVSFHLAWGDEFCTNNVHVQAGQQVYVGLKELLARGVQSQH